MVRLKDLTEATRIKLGSKNKQAEDADEIIAIIRHKGSPHPFNNREVLFGPVGLTVYRTGSEVHISDIRTYQDGGRGNATKVMKWLINLADQNQVNLSGIAKAYLGGNHDTIPTSTELASWYKKLGFAILGGSEEDGFDIKYTPNTIKAPVSENSSHSIASDPDRNWLDSEDLINSTMTEAPIGDYATIGNWGDQEKSNSFRHKQDRKIIQSENLIKKVRKKFGNTEHMLNFYFVNLPGAAKHAEHGIMSPDQLQTELPKAWELIQQREREQGTDAAESINVLFVGNAGFQRVPMTAWIMAHRLGHVLQSAAPIQGYNSDMINSWNDMQRELEEMFVRMFEDVYNWKLSTKSSWGNNTPSLWNHPDVAKFFESIGTMASARNGKLGGRPFEFIYEMFAQYITTGSLKFNELPKRFGRRNSQRYSRYEDSREMYSRDLNMWFSDHITSYMDNLMYEATGKYLVM